MKDKLDIDGILGKDIRKDDLKAYENWLISNRNIGQKQAYNSMVNMLKLFRANAIYNLTVADAWNLAAKIKTSKYSKSHQRHLLQQLESYLMYRGIKSPDGTYVKFAKPRQTRKLPRYLTMDEMSVFVRSAKNLRDTTIIIVFLKSGMRLSELRNLDMGDIDLDNATIKIRSGKGDIDREVLIDEQTVSALQAYFSTYKLVGAPINTPVFKSIRGNRISVHAVEEMVEKVGINAGISFKVTPHQLRHSFGSYMIGKCDINALKELMGHATIEPTGLYLHCNSSEKRQKYNQAIMKF